jgi:hypothetical protein
MLDYKHISYECVLYSILDDIGGMVPYSHRYSIAQRFDTLHSLQIIALYIGSNNATFQAHLYMSLNFHLDFLYKVTDVEARNLDLLF